MWFRKSPQSGGGAQGSQHLRFSDDGQARAEETERALLSGQLPGRVVERMKASRSGELPWTSDLTVNEWHLMRPYGFRPLGLVMGSSYYHVGYNASNRAGSWMRGSGSVRDVEQAMYEGRRLALTRLAQEAQMLGAHAVVGVRLHWKQPEYAGHESEFVAFGTAVALDGEPVPNDPVLCTVDGASFAKLARVGSLPVGVALGVCVYYQASSRQDMWQLNSWFNQEIPMFTDAVYRTRDSAVRSMWRDASSMGASGVLAHETSMTVHEVEVEYGENDRRVDHVVEFLAMGTAVASTKAPSPFAPKYALDLKD